MFKRLLDFLRCPDCGSTFALEPLVMAPGDSEEIEDGLLRCTGGHWFPVVGGVPRMLPDAMEEHWGTLEGAARGSSSEAVQALLQSRSGGEAARHYDRRTRANFSFEWGYHELGDRTWGMELDDRVRWFFLEPIRIPEESLSDKVVLDAGCGNGSQSVAYTRFGLEVIAVDISSGLERGHAFRHRLPGAKPDRVHFVQGDLQHPPLAPESVDIIHSAGVLHATSNTEQTFRGLCPLLQPGGTFYVWFYKYEPVVTPVVNSIRAVTTRMPAPAFARTAKWMAVPFQLFCRTTDRLGIRRYPPMTRREAALALMDIFGAPYAHYHSFPEVAEWYRSEGFTEVWPCNDDRRGFGVCGRLPAADSGADRDAEAVTATP